MRLLAVNAGSTSLKITELDGRDTVAEHPSVDGAIASAGPLDAVVHRVVHGGDRTGAVAVDDPVRAELEALVELAPLHQPPALAALDRCREAWPDVPHIACFDTAFHATIPAAARTYALPLRWRERVRAYGFHGLSYAWTASRMAELAPGARRVVMAHLGGGQSLCALLDGRSIATTMGFTPLDGLVMATRCGSLDPGAVLWMQERTDEDIGAVLEHESGLLGLCGSGDMREVIERSASTGPAAADARFALDVHLHRLVSAIGGMVAALGGLDAIVFTGGVGEHAPTLRAALADRLAWLGVGVEDGRIAGGDAEITAPGATVPAFVVHAREDLQMATDATNLLG